MKLLATSERFVPPTPLNKESTVFGIHMPAAGTVSGSAGKTVNLGFSAEIPKEHAVLVTVNQEMAKRYSLEICGGVATFPSGHSKEWQVGVKTRSGAPFSWEEEDVLFEFLVVHTPAIRLEI